MVFLAAEFIMLLVLLLILSFNTLANPEIIICLGQDNDNGNCTSVATSLNSSTITQNYASLLLMQDIVISEPIKVANRIGITIRGNVEGIRVCCENLESGFTFLQVTNLTIVDITVINCGALQNSTSYGVDPDMPVLFRSSIYMVNCTDITVAGTHVTESGGTGIAMFDCTGTVHIYNSSFTLNQVRNNHESGGGGMYIEFSECGGPTDKFISCSVNSTTYNSYSDYTIEGCIFSGNNKSFIYKKVISVIPYK